MKKYILYWSDGDGCTYHCEHAQPFVTDDIDKWEYGLLCAIKDPGNDFKYDGIQLPAWSTEFSYEIMTLEDWFEKNLV